MWRRNEVQELKIINDCLQPIIWIEPCYLTCSQYRFYAKKNAIGNYYDIKWEILIDESCTSLQGGELMPINISLLQDSTTNEVFLKLYNYDAVISYKY